MDLVAKNNRKSVRHINDILVESFEPLTPEMAEKSKLLRRFDSKFCLNQKLLAPILNEISNDYFVLNINGIRIQKYKTIYYDTPEDLFYLQHHNGKAGRFKIRKRHYCDSDVSFLEVKIKSNSYKTIKERIRIESFTFEFSTIEKDFLYGLTGIDTESLHVKMDNLFHRITLVGKNSDERCTIDMNAVFHSDKSTIEFNNLVLIELKHPKISSKSALGECLKRHKIYPESFSKYCIGRAISGSKIKKNNFKEKLLKLKRNQFYGILTDSQGI